MKPSEGVAIALSGGGFRAMLFHLGALWRLNDMAWLSRFQAVSSVSGGALLAGRLCVRPMLDALRRLDRDQLRDDMRHKVNLIREDYAAFVRQCRAFAQAANLQCDDQVFAEYLEVPEPI